MMILKVAVCQICSSRFIIAAVEVNYIARALESLPPNLPTQIPDCLAESSSVTALLCPLEPD
jgi:hypothetical protein